jgi:hypothetical protein
MGGGCPADRVTQLRARRNLKVIVVGSQVGNNSKNKSIKLYHVERNPVIEYQAEHQRLKSAVVEAARIWYRETKADLITGDNPDLNELLDYERPLFEAVRVLVEVEEHEKGTQATQ